MIFVDHFTRYTWVYTLKRKSQVYDVFTRFKAFVENKFQFKLRTLYTDNGGEYIGLTAFLSTHGISHMISPPHTPEHNGIAERKHRHIAETGLALMSHASMPKSYWTYAFTTAVYLINRMPTPILDFKNPFQILHGHLPNLQKLRIFGCLCFPWIRPYASHKLDVKSTPCVFLGYSTTQSAYFCLDKITSRIYTSRHVVFHESIFPFAITSRQTDQIEISDLESPIYPLVSMIRPACGTLSPPTEDVIPTETTPPSESNESTDHTAPEQISSTDQVTSSASTEDQPVQSP